MGRTKTDLKMTAQLFYPMMQCADIFHLEADICQLGLDQRRANMLAREVGPKLGWWKPVIVSHHMLMGLEGKRQPEGYDENQAFDQQISSKMSKSQPDTCIYVHDSYEAIQNKIQKAFCPPKIIEGNPILEYCKYIIFRKCENLEITRSARYGGDLEIPDYAELSQLYATGTIHPLDLKKAIQLSLLHLEGVLGTALQFPDILPNFQEIPPLPDIQADSSSTTTLLCVIGMPSEDAMLEATDTLNPSDQTTPFGELQHCPSEQHGVGATS